MWSDVLKHIDSATTPKQAIKQYFFAQSVPVCESIPSLNGLYVELIQQG